MPWSVDTLERLRDEAAASARTTVQRQGRDLVLRHAVELVAGDADTLIVNIRGSARAIPVVLTREPDGGVTVASGCDHGDVVCKHVLAALEMACRGVRDSVPLLSPVETGHAPPGEPEEEDPRLPPYDTAQSLQTWADERDLESWLELPAPVAAAFAGIESNAWLRGYYGSEATVAFVILEARDPPRTSRASARASQLAEPPLALRQIFRRMLADQVEVRARVVAREAEWLEALRPPSGEAGEAIWDQLTDLRSRLAPRTRRRDPDVELRVSSHFYDDPPRLSRTEHGRQTCGGSSGAGHALLRMDPEVGEPVVSCRCTGKAGQSCPARLAVIDEALAALSGEGDPAVAEPLRRALTTPAWMRTLDALDDLIAETAPENRPPPKGQLGWRLRWGKTHRVEPVACRPYKSKPGIAMKPVLAEDLREGRRFQLTDQERRAAAELSDVEGQDAAREMVRAMAELVDHPRVFVQTDKGKPVAVAVRRAELSLVLDRSSDGGLDMGFEAGGTRLTPLEVHQAMRRASWADRVLLVEPERHLVVVARFSTDTRALAERLSARTTELAPEAAAELQRRLPSLARLAPLRVDDTLRGDAVETRLMMIVRLTLGADHGMRVEIVAQPLPELPALPPGTGPEQLFAFRADEPIHCVRDLAAESGAAHRLARELALGEEELGMAPCTWRLDHLDDALDLVSRLQALDPEQVRVEWVDDRRLGIVGAGGPGQLNLQLSSRRDWFRLAGALEVDGVEVPLGALLQAIRDGQRYVEVAGDRFMALSDTLRAALRPVAIAASEDGDLSPFAAPLLEELEAEGARLDAPAEWLRLRHLIDEAVTLEVPIPDGFQGELRAYQLEGFRWLAGLAHWGGGACLADDMGLGKTVQALALLQRRAADGAALVVAPTSVGFNWMREAERFTPELRPVLFRGKAHLDRLTGLGPGDVVITSYDLLVRYEDAIRALSLTTLILDEAQAIKNPDTRRAQVAHGLDAGFRVALTGTPVENRAGELWSIFRAIVPGLLGSARHFRERFALPIERDNDPAARAALARLVRPFILRRLKRNVEQELPERTDVTMVVPLSAGERQLYEDVRRAVAADLARSTDEPSGQRRFRVLAALTRLRQLACHPRLVHPRSSVRSSKLDAMVELVTELRDEGHRALVFSQFTSLLALVKEALDEAGVSYRYLDGSLAETARRREVDAFQAGSGDVFLLSLKAGGTGLNLTAADYVIHLDPWWNPAVEDQATDRAHRIGQTRPVTAYRLVAERTVEEDILMMHTDKRELVAALLDGTDSARALSTDELFALVLSAGPADDDA
ncbi:MAG: DEAD/DEAH box helicase [Deltaproteobacteria bacterium]|nr:DEAD/DEAH box helicase [Deltaproteobacteria bacterium]